jgi:hypothetical protein
VLVGGRAVRTAPARISLMPTNEYNYRAIEEDKLAQ